MQKFGIRTSIVAGILILAMILSIIPIAMATGNGAPGGAHFNVNIIGVQSGNAVNASGNGNSVRVELYGPDNVSITDLNGNSSIPVTYEIYVRALGKPGGSANVTTGTVDETGNYWYPLDNVTLTRATGKAIFDAFNNATGNYVWNVDNNGLKLIQIRVYAIRGQTPVPTPTPTPTATPAPTATPTPTPEPSPIPV